jgi:hypothetical protein
MNSNDNEFFKLPFKEVKNNMSKPTVMSLLKPICLPLFERANREKDSELLKALWMLTVLALVFDGRAELDYHEENGFFELCFCTDAALAQDFANLAIPCLAEAAKFAAEDTETMVNVRLQFTLSGRSFDGAANC